MSDQSGDAFAQVEGDVNMPQRVLLNESTRRLFTIIMKCGGPAAYADMGKVRLIRNGTEILIDLRRILPDASNNPLIEAGDLIVVSRVSSAQSK